MNQKKQLYNRSAAGERIRNRREKMGLSRQKMAAQIGKAEKYYADIERGYCGMSLETMIAIAGYLGFTTRLSDFRGKRRERITGRLKNYSFLSGKVRREKAEESNGAFASLPVGIKVLCRYRTRILRDVDGYNVRNCGVSGYFS